MHELHAGRDRHMCNIQNWSIPAVQLTQLRKLSYNIFWGTGGSQKLTVMPSAIVQSGSTTKEVSGWESKLQWKVQQMSGIQPVAIPNPSTVSNICMWLWCEGAVGCTR
jgi:hypothetical protein